MSKKISLIFGIDFSINSTAITIYDVDKDEYEYLSVLRMVNDGKKEKFQAVSEKTAKLASDNGIIVYGINSTAQWAFTPPKKMKEKSLCKYTYNDCEIEKLSGAQIMSNSIIDIIYEHAQKLELRGGDLSQIKIYLEGFSYSSMGRSMLDITLYNTTLRNALYCNFGRDSLKIISPSMLKKHLSGSGGSDKLAMVRSYIEYWYPLCNKHTKNSLYNFIESTLSSGEDIRELTKCPKPIDDLVDSYALCSYAKYELNIIK